MTTGQNAYYELMERYGGDIKKASKARIPASSTTKP